MVVVTKTLTDKGVDALDKVIKKREDANPHVVLLGMAVQCACMMGVIGVVMARYQMMS